MSEDEDRSMVIEVTEIDGVVDRLWLRLVADPEEKVFGGGEQFSYLNLRGQAFPMWTREQGKASFGKEVKNVPVAVSFPVCEDYGEGFDKSIHVCVYLFIYLLL